MKPSIEKLQKFFRLEANRNYDNKAVMGGLEHMLEGWELEARADDLPEELIQAVVIRLRDYQRLSEASRKETLHGIWTRVQRETGAQDIERAPAPQAETQPEVQTDIQAESQPTASETPAQREEIAASEPPPPPKEETKPEKSLPPAKPERVARPEGPSAALNASVTVLPRVGDHKAKTLNRIGIQTLADMLYYFPRRYDDYSQLTPINRLKYNQKTTIIGTVQSVSSREIRGGKSKMVEAVVSDGSAAIRVTWFNQPWITQKLRKGLQIVFSGKVEQYLGRLTINNPEWELLDRKTLHTNRIVPIYPLTTNITQRWLRSQMDQVVNYWAPQRRRPAARACAGWSRSDQLERGFAASTFPRFARSTPGRPSSPGF